MSFEYCLNGLNPLTALTPLQNEEEYRRFEANFDEYRSIYEGCNRHYPSDPPRNIPALMNERLSRFLKRSPYFAKADPESQGEMMVSLASRFLKMSPDFEKADPESRREMMAALVDRTEGPIERGFLPVLPAGGLGGGLLGSGGLVAFSGVKALHKRKTIGLWAEPIVRLPSRCGHWWYPATIGVPMIAGLVIGLGLTELSYRTIQKERNEKVDRLLDQ